MQKIKSHIAFIIAIVVMFGTLTACTISEKITKTLGLGDNSKKEVKTEVKQEPEHNSTVDTKKQITSKDVSQLTDVQAMDLVRSMSRQEKEDLFKFDPKTNTWTAQAIVAQLIGKFDKKNDKRYVYQPELSMYSALGEDGGSPELIGNSWFAYYKMFPPNYDKWAWHKQADGTFTFTYPEGTSLMELSIIQFDTDNNGYCIPETRRWAKIGDCVVEKEPGSNEGWAPWWLNTVRQRYTLKAPGFIKEHGAGTWTE